MKANSAKNQALLKDHPYLVKILAVPQEYFGRDQSHLLESLKISFEKADGDLMYREARNIGMGDGSFAFSTKDDRKEQVMRCAEFLFAIDRHDEIVNMVSWPKNGDEARGVGPVYGNHVFWKNRERSGRGGWSLSNSICAEVQCLVWVTLEAWHKDTRQDEPVGARFGEMVGMSVTMTVYNEPGNGFEKLSMEDSSLETNLRLNTSKLIRAAVENDARISGIGARMDELCVQFQDEVYFNGMKEVLDKGNARGASGQFGPVKVLCAEMCGYDRVMLEDDTSFVSFQLRPGAKHMYVLGMDGTLPQIRQLVRHVVKVWNGKPEIRASFKPDGNVSVI